MTTPTSGQRGQSDAPRSLYEITRAAERIPEHVLRAFLAEECALHSLREVARRVSTSHETVRQIVEGPAREMHRRTRQKLGAYYLSRHPAGYVAERPPPYSAAAPLPQLKAILPPGHAAARAEVEKLVELAKRFPDEAPASADGLRAWLETLLDAEYTGEDISRRRRSRRARRRAADRQG